MSRQACATSFGVCYSRASDRKEKRKSCWGCIGKISAMYSLTRCISAYEERIEFQIVENREEACSQASNLVHCSAEGMTGLWLLNKPLLLGHPHLMNYSATEEFSQVRKPPCVLTLNCFPTELPPNPVNFI